MRGRPRAGRHKSFAAAAPAGLSKDRDNGLTLPISASLKQHERIFGGYLLPAKHSISIAG